MKHSAELWFFIRTIYENCLENVTLQQIIDKAQEYFPNDTMPSYKSLSRKINQEKWKKKGAGSLFGLNNQSLIKILLEHRTIKKEYNDLKKNERYEMMALEHEVKFEKLFSERQFLQRKLSGVIIDHRRNNYKVSVFLARKMEQYLEIEEKVINFVEYYNNNRDEFGDLDFETAFKIQIKNLQIVADGILSAESMSRTVTNLMKNDVFLYGIVHDDTREPDTSKRLASLNEDVEYYAEQERLALENQKRIAERMALLQSGVYEEQVRQKALEDARQYEVNSDIDDAEFDEIL